MDEVPRGIKTRNPGNIRISETHWHGKLTPSIDPDFETFDKMVNGIRAIGKILLTYQSAYDLRTIREFITHWAPPSDDNPTDAYITNVADRSGFDPDAKLDMHRASDQAGVITGIIDQENGGLWGITPDQISAGVNLALT